MPDIPQNERHGEKMAVTYYNSATGDYEKRPLLGDASGSAHVLDGITQVPRYSVTPTVGGTPCGMLRIISGTGDTIEGLRFIVNAGDDVLAAEALSAMKDGAQMAYVDTDMAIYTDEPITGIHVLAVGSAQANGLYNVNGTSQEGDMVVYNETAANIISNASMAELVFLESDNVRAVSFSLSGEQFDPPKVNISVEGKSYA